MIKMRKNVKPGKTPAEITVSMIDQDLKDGISKPEMATKYGIKPWEVDEIFKHPLLKGRRPSRKKALSFTFEDDMTDAVDPNQVTLEDAIQDTIDEVKDIQENLKKTEKEILEILSPTPFHSPEEEVIEKLTTNSEADYDDGEDDEYISDTKEIDLDDEIDDSFEL